MSNSSAPDIVAAYGGPAARAAGLTLEYVPARRAINSRATLRGPVDELIITNATMRAMRDVALRMLLARRSKKAKGQKSNVS